ncbi:MAG: hypothetical protein QOF98_124, partial [Streptomyces sp.]|nr:hypothetical protein [Streptomyces sp.]
MVVIHEPERSAVPWRTTGAVEIRSSADGAPHLLGSGHQVTGSLLLTAGHVVHREAGARQRVRFLDGRTDIPYDAELLWHSAGVCPLHEGRCPDAERAPTRGLDLALLRLPPTGGSDTPAAVARRGSVRWGRFVTGEPHPVTVTGVPGGRRRAGPHGQHGLPGTVSPATGYGDAQYELKPGGQGPDGAPPDTVPLFPLETWHGVAGAAVFCEGLLIGCVQRRAREGGTLYVLPAARLLQHGCLARLLAEDTQTDPVAEAVELRPYLTGPVPTPRTPAALLDAEAAA